MAIGGATVTLFKTATNTQIALSQTSAPDGTYSLGAPTAETCFVVAYKAGSPDIAGTTVNTLVPS